MPTSRLWETLGGPEPLFDCSQGACRLPNTEQATFFFRGGDMVSDRTERRRKAMRSIAQAYRDAQELMTACILLGVFIWGGFWLDQRYGLKPLLTLSGVFLGLLTAGIFLWQFMKRMERRRKLAEDRRSDDRKQRSERCD